MSAIYVPYRNMPNLTSCLPCSKKPENDITSGMDTQTHTDVEDNLTNQAHIPVRCTPGPGGQ